MKQKLALIVGLAVSTACLSTFGTTTTFTMTGPGSGAGGCGAHYTPNGCGGDFSFYTSSPNTWTYSGPCTTLNFLTSGAYYPLAMNGSTYTFYLDASCNLSTNGAPPTNYCMRFAYTNTTPFIQAVVPYVSFVGSSCTDPSGQGGPAGPQNGYSLAQLMPGEATAFMACYTCAWNCWYEAFPVGGTNQTPTLTPTNTQGTAISTTNQVGSGTGIVKAGMGTGGPKPSTATGLGSNTNLTGGQFYSGVNDLGSVLYQGFEQLHSDMSGTTGGTGTNGLGVYSTNTSKGQYSSYGTNAGNGASALGAADTGAASAISAIGTNPPSSSGGSASALSFSFATGTINLDPDSIMPGIPAIVRQLLGWGATIWFIVWFAGAYKDCVQMMAGAELGGVPDMDVEVAGFGGNVVGVATAVAVPLVFIGLWIGIFTYGFNSLAQYLAGAYFTTNPFTSLSSGGSGPSAALYLMNELLPLGYLMAIGWTRIGLMFTLPKLAAIAVASGRFLFGK
jgi:hypothetical protein